jgi:hypothetical protein
MRTGWVTTTALMVPSVGEPPHLNMRNEAHYVGRSVGELASPLPLPPFDLSLSPAARDPAHFGCPPPIIASLPCG